MAASALSSDFQFEKFEVTSDVKEAFDRNGYIIVRGLLSGEELQHLRNALEDPEGVMAMQYDVGDGQGKVVKMALWSNPGNDVTGMVARSEKVAGTFDKLLGGEVYHYHAKISLKKPKSGGAHIWHQDYGYWYEYGNLFPNMGTCFIAIDRATKENGCLQVYAGSNRAGRIEHVRSGDQAGADPERVKQLGRFCEHLHVEMEPGDALFFHGNTLHHSEQNLSDKRRLAYIMAFNRADNDPVYDQLHREHHYAPLQKVPNSAILECSNVKDLSGKVFYTEDGLQNAMGKFKSSGDK